MASLWPRRLSLPTWLATGVFTSLGFSGAWHQHGFGTDHLWMIGGVIAFCGAASYAELGAMMPRSGGEYHFLSRIFHPAFGFMSGWISFSIGFAAPIAAASMAFGGYLIGTFHLSAITAGMNTQMLCAAAMIIVLTFVHLAERSIGSAVQTFRVYDAKSASNFLPYCCRPLSREYVGTFICDFRRCSARDVDAGVCDLTLLCDLFVLRMECRGLTLREEIEIRSGIFRAPL